MELAQTPRLPEHMSATDPARKARAGCHADVSVRLLTPADCAETQFTDRWAELTERASEPNPFFEPWFMQPSLDQFAQNNECSLLCVFSNDDLIGLMPIERSNNYYGNPVPHIRTWHHPNIFCCTPLIAAGFELAFWKALLSWCDRNPGRAMFMHLPQLTTDGPVHSALEMALDRPERGSAIVESVTRAKLDSDLGPAEYFAQAMSTKKRKELRRQKNRLAEHGKLIVERTSGHERLEPWIADYLALEAAGWKGNAGSALACAPGTNSFFASALIGAAKAGRLERLSLLLGRRPIAMLANFITPPGVFSFKTTFDEEFSRYSPGLMLQVENLELLKHTDVMWADSCAAEGHTMIERIWREKRRIISRNIAIGGTARRLLFAGLAAYETRGRDRAKTAVHPNSNANSSGNHSQ